MVKVVVVIYKYKEGEVMVMEEVVTCNSREVEEMEMVAVVIYRNKEVVVKEKVEVVICSSKVVAEREMEEVETCSSNEVEEMVMGVVGTYSSMENVVMERVMVVICSGKVDTHAGNTVVEVEMHKCKACRLQLHYWLSSKTPKQKLDEAKNWPFPATLKSDPQNAGLLPQNVYRRNL